jgi:hypothetical protein
MDLTRREMYLDKLQSRRIQTGILIRLYLFGVILHRLCKSKRDYGLWRDINSYFESTKVLRVLIRRPTAKTIPTMVSIRKEQEQQGCENGVGRGGVKRTRTRKAERSVSFYPHVVVQPVLVHLDDYTNAEIEACWFGELEISLLLKGIRQTINLIEQNILLDNDNRYCSRGLETFTTKGTIQKNQIRAKARDAVLDQQDVLRWQTESMIDEHKIAEVYRGSTQESQMAAYTKGVSDAATIRAMDAVQEIATRTKIIESTLGHDMPLERSQPDHLSSPKNGKLARAA